MRDYLRLRICYTYVLSLIILTVFVKAHDQPWDTFSHINYKICKDFKSFERAQYVESSLQKSVDPCKDFYQYACGGWIKNNPVPTTEVEYSMETYLKMTAVYKIQQLLEQEDHPNETANVKAARKVYRECMKRPDLGRIDVGALKSHMTKVAFWPLCSSFEHETTSSKSWIKVLKYYLTISRDSPLFDIFITVNKESEPIIQIEELATPFVMLDVIEWNKLKEELYMKFLRALIKKLDIFTFPDCKIDTRIREVVRFRKQLDQFITDTSLKKHQYLNNIETMTIKQFQQWYDNKVVNLSTRTFISWLDILRIAFPTVNDQAISADTEINVANKKYFELLVSLIDQTPSRVIVNHIQLYFAETHLKMDSKLMKLLSQVILKDNTFYDEILMDIDNIHACILDHPMPDIVASMYNKAFLTKDIKSDVYALAEDIKYMLKTQMMHSKWLQDSMKFEIGEKLNETRAFIGVKEVFVKKWKRPWLHEQKHMETRISPSAMPEATYAVDSGYILIGSGYLQQPIYDINIPYVINYGSLGPLLGHEFFHSIQSSLSKKFIKSVKKEHNETSDMYNKKSNCFVQHYKQFDVKELSDLPGYCHVKPNTVRTLQENIADAMGLKAAYDAYRRKLWQKKHVCPIPLFNLKLSCDQLFFISFALTFCGNIPSTELRKQLKRLEHLPPRIRVNGAVSNLKAFSDAFHCSKNTALNPKKKCDLWA